MIWGHVNSNLTGFRGIASICCKLVGGKAICLNGDAGSCGGGQAACLLFKVKEPWVEPGIPVFDVDTQCLRTLTTLKNTFDKKRRNKNIKIEDKTAYIQKLSSTTLCLLPEDWEWRIMSEAFLTSAHNRERVNAVQDYIGIAATRSAIMDPESEFIRRGRRAWRNKEVQEEEPRDMRELGGVMEGSIEPGELEPGELPDIENNSQQEQEGRQQQLGASSQSEGIAGVDSQESIGVEQERRYAKEARRQKLAKRKRKRA